MKKIIYSAMAVAILATTSCKDDFAESFVGDQATVEFSISTPEIGTRYGEGTTATHLQYAVYDAAGEELTALTKTDGEIHSSAKVTLDLTTGDTYTVVFWAAAPNAPYTVNFANKTMTVDYSAAKTFSNDESRDAFYAVETFTVNGAESKTIELKRPFAQLNIGTEDYEKATNAGYTPTKSSVTVSKIYSTLTFFDNQGNKGIVSNDAEETFAMADINKGEKFPVDGYEYLAMNYLLVPADKGLVDVEFGYKEENGEAKTRTISNVPVQRNYRTNIYGKLLTSEVDVNVEIKPGFGGEFDNEGYFVETGANGETVAIVESANGLATIAEMIEEGELGSDVNIALEGDIDLADLAPSMRSIVVSNWTPIGTSEKPFTGAFDGRGYTIKNLALVESEAKEGKAYIGFFGYAKDVTIKNVVFENVYINIPCLDIDHSQGHIGAVAGSLEGTSTIENVTVKGDIQVYATQDANGASRVAVVAGGNSYGNVTMKNVHVVANEGSYLKANNNTGALAGQLQGKSVFENCSSNIDVTVNKFFAGGLIGLAAGDQLFKNCHTTGDVAVVAGREGRHNDEYRVGGIAGGWADGKTKVCTLEGCTYTGTVSGTNADGSVANPLDYMGYVGRGYTLANCEGSKVIIDGVEFVQVGNAAPYGNYTVKKNGQDVIAVASKEDLPKDNDKINTNFEENAFLFGDITLSANETNANSGYGATGVKVVAGAVLDGQGHTLTVNDAWGTWDCVANTTGGTIKNLTIKGAMRGIFMSGATADVYIDNVIFDNVIYTFNSDAGNKNYGVYISNSTLNGWTSHSDVHKEVVYTNCSFGEGNGYAFCRPYGPTTFKNCTFEAGFEVEAIGVVTFENCTIGGVALTAANLNTLVVGGIKNATVK